MALRVPNPNPLRTGDVNVSLSIDSHAIRHSIGFPSRLFAKDTAVRDRSVGRNVIDANISLLAVIDVKVFSIWGKR